MANSIASLFVSIGADIKGLQAGLAQAEQAITRTAQTAGNAVRGIGLGVGALALAGAGAIAGVMHETLAWGEQLDQLNDTLGLSGRQAAAWAASMNHVGISVDEGASGINVFIRNLEASRVAAQQAGEAYNDAFSDLQENIRDASEENARNISEIRQDLNDNLAELGRDWLKQQSAFAKEERDINRQALEDETIAHTYADVLRIRKSAQARRDELAQKKKDALEEYNHRIKLAKEASAEQIAAVERAADKQAKAFDRSLEKLGKTLQAATESNPLDKALKKLGVTAYDAQGNIRPIVPLMGDIMRAFAKLPPGVEASAIAMQLFGRSGSKFLDFLREGTASGASISKAFGLDLTNAQVAAMEQFGRSLNDLKLGFQGVAVQVGVNLLPYLQQLLDYINKTVLPAFIKWEKENMPGIAKQLGELGTQVGGFLVELGNAFKEGGVGAVLDKIGKLAGQMIERIKNEWAPKFAAWISEWVNSPETQAMVRGVGESIGNGISDGIKSAITNIDWSGFYRDALGAYLGIVTGQPGVNAGASAAKWLKGYASGGTVPGAMGQPQLAIVHGGETIIPTNRSGGGGRSVSVTINGNVYGVDDLQRAIWGAIDRYDRGLA